MARSATAQDAETTQKQPRSLSLTDQDVFLSDVGACWHSRYIDTRYDVSCQYVQCHIIDTFEIGNRSTR